jgi:hypothetical protein
MVLVFRQGLLDLKACVRLLVEAAGNNNTTR